MAEEDGAGVEAHGKIHQLIAISVGGEIKAIHLAMAREFTTAFAEVKGLTARCSTQFAGGCVGRSVADEVNGMSLHRRHTHRQLVRQSMFAHHAGGDDKQGTVEFDFVQLFALEHAEIQRIAQIQIWPTIGCAPRDEIVNFRKHSAEPTDVNRLFAKIPALHGQRDHAQNFLRATERKHWNKHARVAIEPGADGVQKPLSLFVAREAFGRFGVAACGFQNQHICLQPIKIRLGQKRLVVETDVTGIKQTFFLMRHADAGGAQHVAGMMERKRRRFPFTRKCAPRFHVAIFKPLK